MAKKNKKKSIAGPVRLVFQRDEKRFDWLSMLLDAYHTCDQGVAKAIAKRLETGQELACKKGCSTCCVTHRNIPTYPIELVGITWYATEKMEDPLRMRLKERLFDHKKGDPCAFLIDGACSIHPMRPLACRQFNVFGQSCAEGEDAYFTRRQDVLAPIGKHMDRAFFLMLPFYGVKDSAQRKQIIAAGQHHSVVQDMHTLNWDSLARKMMDWETDKAQYGG